MADNNLRVLVRQSDRCLLGALEDVFKVNEGVADLRVQLQLFCGKLQFCVYEYPEIETSLKRIAAELSQPTLGTWDRSRRLSNYLTSQLVSYMFLGIDRDSKKAADYMSFCEECDRAGKDKTSFESKEELHGTVSHTAASVQVVTPQHGTESHTADVTPASVSNPGEARRGETEDGKTAEETWSLSSNEARYHANKVSLRRRVINLEEKMDRLLERMTALEETFLRCQKASGPVQPEAEAPYSLSSVELSAAGGAETDVEEGAIYVALLQGGTVMFAMKIMMFLKFIFGSLMLAMIHMWCGRRRMKKLEQFSEDACKVDSDDVEESKLKLMKLKRDELQLACLARGLVTETSRHTKDELVHKLVEFKPTAPTEVPPTQAQVRYLADLEIATGRKAKLSAYHCKTKASQEIDRLKALKYD